MKRKFLDIISRFMVWRKMTDDEVINYVLTVDIFSYAFDIAFYNPNDDTNYKLFEKNRISIKQKLEEKYYSFEFLYVFIDDYCDDCLVNDDDSTDCKHCLGNVLPILDFLDYMQYNHQSAITQIRKIKQRRKDLENLYLYH
jgi:hypothetical protein